MLLEEIQVYIDSIGKPISLFGFTSTSMKEDLALSFAWENATSKHQKVLFHFQFSN